MNLEKVAYNQLKDFYDAVKNGLKRPMDFYPVDIETILNNNGWSVVLVNGLDGVARFDTGYMAHASCNYSTREVTIDSNQSVERNRFSMAHELGHILLHDRGHEMHFRRPHSTRPNLANSKPPELSEKVRREEIEANQFAAHILMPEKAIRAYFFTVFGKNSVRVVDDAMKTANEKLADLCVYEDGRNDSLCARFQVSKAAMIYRLKGLRLVVCV